MCCVVETHAGVASASPGLCCCSSSYSLKQSEDLPIDMEVAHQKACRGFGGRAVFRSCYGTDAAALAGGVNLMPLNSREWDLKNSTPP